MKIICISGKAQNGKDTTAQYLQQLLQQKNKRVVIIHYADLLKYICEKYFGWNGVKDGNGRTLLQHVGTGIVRKRAPDYWIEHVIKMLEVFNDCWDYVLIPDTRFPNEVDCWKEHNYDAVHLRVTRQDFDSPLSPEQQQHPSEIALDNVEPDYELNNTTLENLYTEIDKFVTRLDN